MTAPENAASLLWVEGRLETRHLRFCVGAESARVTGELTTRGRAPITISSRVKVRGGAGGFDSAFRSCARRLVDRYLDVAGANRQSVRWANGVLDEIGMPSVRLVRWAVQGCEEIELAPDREADVMLESPDGFVRVRPGASQNAVMRAALALRCGDRSLAIRRLT